MGRTVARVLGGWLKGSLILSSAIAVLLAVGFSIAGVPYALALGVVGGLLNVVPYVGPVVTTVLAVVAGLSVGPWTALWAVVVVGAVELLNQTVLGPRIFSEQVDLHPLVVIFALLVGAALFGIPGMVLAVPVAAIIGGLFVYWFERSTERRIGSEDSVLFRDSTAGSEEDTPRH